MSNVEWVTSRSDFNDLLETEDVLVVDFTAPDRCRPCQQLAPHFEKAAEKSNAKFIAVDVDKTPWAIEDFGVRGVPTVMLFRDGEYVVNLQERTAVRLLDEVNNYG